MPLERLPSEIVEWIVESLPLRDICSLRLTGRTLASHVVQECFKASLRCKRVEVSRQGLGKFIAGLRRNNLLCLLQRLTMVAPVYNTLELEACLEQRTTTVPQRAPNGRFEELGSRKLGEKEVEQVEKELLLLQHLQRDHSDWLTRGEDVSLLSQALASLAEHGVRLRTICLEVAVFRLDATTPLLPLYGGGWKHIWAAAGSLTKALFASLAASGTCVAELNVFDTARMQRCSVPCDVFSTLDFSSDATRTTLANLESLSISISDKIILQSENEPMNLEDYSSDVNSGNDDWDWGRWRTHEELQSEAERQDNLSGLSSMLHLCSALQMLSISYCKLTRKGDPLPILSDRDSSCDFRSCSSHMCKC